MLSWPAWGGGSNAIGNFLPNFLEDASVKIDWGRTSWQGDWIPRIMPQTMTLGTKGTIHGFKCYNLQDENGEPLPVHSIASGLDYPGVGPQHCYLKDMGRVAVRIHYRR